MDQLFTVWNKFGVKVRIYYISSLFSPIDSIFGGHHYPFLIVRSIPRNSLWSIRVISTPLLYISITAGPNLSLFGTYISAIQFYQPTKTLRLPTATSSGNRITLINHSKLNISGSIWPIPSIFYHTLLVSCTCLGSRFRINSSTLSLRIQQTLPNSFPYPFQHVQLTPRLSKTLRHQL